MDHLLTVMIVAGSSILVVAVGFDFAQRQFTRARNGSRMGQALRRGLAQPQG